MHRRLTEPMLSWTETRAVVLRGFGDGLNLKVDEAKLARSEAKLKADKMLRFKILMRTARGHAGLLTEMLNGHGITTQQGKAQAVMRCRTAEKRESCLLRSSTVCRL